MENILLAFLQQLRKVLWLHLSVRSVAQDKENPPAVHNGRESQT
jgi:hypothetical protein